MMTNGAASWHRLSKPRKQVHLAHTNIFLACRPCLTMGNPEIVSLCLVSLDRPHGRASPTNHFSYADFSLREEPGAGLTHLYAGLTHLYKD